MIREDQIAVSDNPEAKLSTWRTRIDEELGRIAVDREDLPVRMRDAVHYSLTGEGKRLRGLLLMASFDALRGSGDAAALAASVEVVHAYSLVHDDLPCMDDDNVRRGRPTTHRKFDVATATIAGVTMVPLAVDQVLTGARRLGLDDRSTRQLVKVLMQASGASGMVGGQLMDLQGEGNRLSVLELESMHRAKTGSLIETSITMGGIAARAGDRALGALSMAGAAIGLAFQIADDVLDATASTETLGKTAGKDAEQAKSTYASVLGVADAGRRRDDLVADAMSALEAAGLRTAVLERLAHFVAARRS